MPEDLDWDYYREHPVTLHRKVEFSVSSPTWVRRFWTWILYAHRSEMRERRYIFFRILGIQIEYSYQWLSDDAAEELLQFIQDEQAAGEDFGDGDYYDPEAEAFHYERGDIE